jgi:transcriptional regulator with XRE-family HTH domain
VKLGRGGRLPDHGNPSVRGRRLAAELRRLREQAGLTGDEVAQRLGWSGSKVSRIELRRTGVKQADLNRLMDLYQVAEPHRGELFALARESSERNSLDQATASFPPEYADHLRMEAEAESAWTWEPQVAPGLLQTEDYARALMRGWQSMFALPPGDLERRVQARLVRQQLLTRDPPLALSVVIDESVLHRRFGDNRIMNQQLRRLAEVSELPNVDLRVLPLDGDHPTGTGAFNYFRFAQVHEVPLHDIVTVEHLTGHDYVEDDEGTNKFRVTFEHLTALSHDPVLSRDLILRTAEQVWP